MRFLICFALLSVAYAHHSSEDGTSNGSSGEGTSRLKSTTACEDTNLSITCSSGVISIVSANFGRTSSVPCATGPTTDTNCRSTTSLGIMQQQCDGKASCSIDATTAIFGEPCAGTLKYLEVKYKCVSASSTRRQICEGATDTLTCPTGTTIDITYANYGRTDLATCPNDPRPNLACQKNVTDIVKTSCQGKATCTLISSNNNYGDPCSGNTKYLDVGYRCVSKITICETNRGTISCPSGTVLEIIDGTYGRQDSTTCLNSSLGSATNTNCNSPNGARVARRCNSLRSCTISANDRTYSGDPCSDTSKYATVTYICKPRS